MGFLEGGVVARCRGAFYLRKTWSQTLLVEVKFSVVISMSPSIVQSSRFHYHKFQVPSIKVVSRHSRDYTHKCCGSTSSICIEIEIEIYLSTTPVFAIIMMDLHSLTYVYRTRPGLMIIWHSNVTSVSVMNPFRRRVDYFLKTQRTLPRLYVFAP